MGDRILRIGAVIGPAQAHLARAYEAAEVVDVAVRFIEIHPPPQPDDDLDPEIGAQVLLDLRAREIGIAVRIEQTLFGSNARALPVHVDRPTLEYQRRAITVEPLDRQHLARHAFIPVPGYVQPAVQAAPGVEAPIDATTLAAVIDDDCRSDIAHPCIIAGDLHHAHALCQLRSRIRELRSRCADFHRLEFRDRCGYGGKRRLRRCRIHSPVVPALRPKQPAAGVRLELAGHVEAMACWGTSDGSAHGLLATRDARDTEL